MTSKHGPQHHGVAEHPPSHSGAALTLQKVTPAQAGLIALALPALDAEGRIADVYSAYFDDRVPAVNWNPVLEARSYVLVVEDPDAPMAQPFIHWLIWNIPGDATGIPEGLSRVAHPPELPGAVQGHNSGGGVGWHGTRPPEGDAPHHYHFQLFALSGELPHFGPTTTLAELIDPLKGMTLGAGEIVGLYERPDPLADQAASTGADRGGLDRDDVDQHAPHSPDGDILRR